MSEKTITIGFTNNEYSNIELLAKKRGLSISQYIKSEIIPNEFEEKYKELLQKVKKLKSGDEFNIKILWKPDEWDNISKGVKLSLGKHFYKNIEVKNIEDVIIKGFGKAGIMLYTKK